MKTLLAMVLLMLFSASAQAASVTVTWVDTPPGPNNAPEEGFNVQRNLNGGTFSTIGAVTADVTTYVDTTITSPPAVTEPAPPNKNTYCYQVVAWNKNPAKTGTLQTAAPSNQSCVDYLGLVNPAPVGPPAAASSATTVLDTSAPRGATTKGKAKGK